jgi:hypothetical protein
VRRRKDTSFVIIMALIKTIVTNICPQRKNMNTLLEDCTTNVYNETRFLLAIEIPRL